MTKTKSTKRALLTSGLVLIMCVTMLIGTTFAWFTDSVTSAGNIIKSGKLDVEMYWANGTEAPDTAAWNDASTGTIFNYDLWEPGYTEVRHIKIANEGSLAFNYQLSIAANGEVSKLADVIDVYFVDPAVQVADRTALNGVAPVGTLTEVLAGMPGNASGDLLAKETDIVTLALKMQETAGNEYQNLAIGSDFSVILAATQKEFEYDSFGNDYDEDANRESNITVNTLNDIEEAFEDAKDGDVLTLANNLNVANTLVYDTDAAITLDLGGYSLEGNLDTLLNVASGNVTIQNGTIKNVKDKATDTLVSVRVAGDSVAVIKDVTIETTGTGLLLEGNAKVTELNAKVNSYANENGSCTADAISLNGNARIDLISGGEYVATYSDDFINAYSGAFSGVAFYPVSVRSADASIGEISGGTFLGRADDGRNGATIFVNAGKIEKISGGYFGYCKYTMRNYPYFLITVNTANGASIDAITGGTFEYASGFGCDFDNIVAQSGSKIEKRAEKVTVSVKLSSSVKTKDVEVWDVVAQ